MKKLLTAIIIISILTATGIIASANIQPNITSHNINVTVNPGNTFEMGIILYSNLPEEITNITLSVDDHSPFTLVHGSRTINNAVTGNQYSYNFLAPADTLPGVYYILYSATYSYDVPGNPAPVVQSSNFSATVTVIGTAQRGTVRIENLQANDVGVGQEAVVSAMLFNTNPTAFTDVRVEILSGNNVIASKYIGRFEGEHGFLEEFKIPAFTTAGGRNLALRVTFTDDRNTRTEQRSFALRVNASEPLTIENLNFPETVAADSPAVINFDVLNTGTDDYRNAQLRFYHGANLIHSASIGTIAAGSTVPLNIEHTFTTAERANLKIAITYRDAANNNLRTERNFSITVNAASQLEIIEITSPPSIEIGTSADIIFTLVNRGRVDFINTQAFLFIDGRQVRSKFIGRVSAQDSVTDSINYIFDKGSENSAYEIRVTYENTSGTTFELKRNFSPDFKEDETESGTLRIQSIVPPFDVLVRTQTPVSFRLTNPTKTDIIGAEASLYDTRGVQLNSVYLPVVMGNSMDELTLSFLSENTAGLHSYTLQITYTDADEKTHIINRQFTVNTMTELPETPEPYRPANIIVQRVDNPSAIYNNVATDIPFQLVNAGRGPAHHVQVYVEDLWGNELAREYIGTVLAADRATDKVRLRFDRVDEFELVFFVTYENADESTGSAFRSFSQRVIDYRASVMDIMGHDWLMQGEPANFEFSVLNNGSESLLNATAILTDENGTTHAEIFIGTIEPGTKRERLRFRNVTFWEAGMFELTISVSYENADMKEFTFSNSVSAMVNEMWRGDMNFGDDEMVMWGNEWDFMEADGEGGGLAWWIWALIIAGVSIPGLVVLIIFLKKASRKRENAEMENFIKLMAAGGTLPAEPNTNVSTANIEE